MAILEPQSGPGGRLLSVREGVRVRYYIRLLVRRLGLIKLLLEQPSQGRSLLGGLL